MSTESAPAVPTELSTSPSSTSWREEDGVSYFSVANDDGTMTDIAVLKGRLFDDNGRSTEDVLVYAKGFVTHDGRTLGRPNMELTNFICEQLKYGGIKISGVLRLVIMHEPKRNSFGLSFLSSLDPYGSHWLFDGCPSVDDKIWGCDTGFVFEVLNE